MRRNTFTDIAVVLVVVLALIFVAHAVGTPFRVDRANMEPSFETGDMILADTGASPDTLMRGDIIVMRGAAGTPLAGQGLVRRVIGLPGDTISIEGGGVRVNGAFIREPYLLPQTVTVPTLPAFVSQFALAEGQLFVLGDHRDTAIDSRAFGPITYQAVVGRVTFRFWPPDRLGFVGP
jgi:signal peptidase I